MNSHIPEWKDSPNHQGRKYKIRGLSGLEFIEYSSHLGANVRGKKIIVTADQLRVTLRGVLDWQGVLEDGEPVPFDMDTLEQRLSPDEAGWLVREILSRSSTSKEQEKNSQSQLKSPKTAETSTAQSAPSETSAATTATNQTPPPASVG